MGRGPGRPPAAKNLKDYFASGTGRKLWQEGKNKLAEGGFQSEVYDDGRYEVKLTDAYSSISQNGRPQNVFGFKFVDGDYKGRKVMKYQGVNNEVGISILLRDFALMGVKIEEPEEIDAANKKILKKGATLLIRLKTNGEYQNVILEKLTEGGSSVESEEADEDVEDNDESDDTDTETDDEADEEKEEKETEEKESDSDDSDEDDEDEEKDEEEEEKPAPKKTKKAEKSSDDEEEEADEETEEEDEDSDDDKEEKEEEDEEVELAVGMKVKLKDGSKGKIVKIYEDDEKVKIKLPNGEKKKVSIDQIVDLA